MADNNDQFNIHELAEKWATGRITAEEQAWLEKWYAEFNEEEITLTNSRHQDSGALKKAMLDQINAGIEKEGGPTRTLWRWRNLAAAASILFFLSAGSYFLFHKAPPQQQTAQNQKQDIAPGQKQVTLTLANGQKLNVNNKLKGKLAQQGNMMVQVNNGNALTYTALAVNQNLSEVAYNTLSTARGQESPFPLVLADGTQVWLNAASSITYPTSFNGKDRVVKITGEVYIKVAHNAARPFKVLVRGQTIDDIGTTFNINAYDDEPVIKTTLIDGSVKISNTTGSAILKPGQQAIIQPDNQNIKVKDADIEEAIAWKNDYFIFNHEKIQSIMRKISRWYDVEVVYEDGISTDWVGGSESRSKNVSEVLRKIELTGQFHFKIEGKKIIVQK
ncbi:MAG: anti-FecI sigma factor, FecR [Mucilaginibacter sp.]|nr:anti-FecI sigma factor, FecR [Mucilaginibacter sp.]